MGDPQWLDDEEMHAWRSLVDANNRLSALLDAELVAAHDLTLADYVVFVHLSAAPDHRLRMSELAERLHLSPSGLTRRLDRLSKDGLVARERCPSDRRGTFAVLTPAGYDRLVEAAPTHVRGVRSHFVSALSRRQLRDIAESLDSVLDHLSPDRPADAPPGPARAATR
jgi:DNA-binding MarR family transcriptional regulator